MVPLLLLLVATPLVYDVFDGSREVEVKSVRTLLVIIYRSRDGTTHNFSMPIRNKKSNDGEVRVEEKKVSLNV